MEPISALDAMFLVGETEANPTHASILLVFENPSPASDDYVRAVYERIVANTDYHPTFSKRVTRVRGKLAWDFVDKVDPSYHIRYLTLPPPGGPNEVHALVSRSRTTLLDRSRPLWEAAIVAGMAGDRFAISVKVHHSLLDGMGFVRFIQDCLSTDPASDDGVALWNRPKSWSPPAESRPTPSTLRGVVGGAHDIIRDAKAFRRTVRRDSSLVLPYPNPKVGAGGNAHGMALRSWEFARFDAIRHAVGGVSVNDVIVAAAGGALRSYLLDLGALPDASLKAMVPIATRTPDEADTGGNAVGAIVADLGTDRTTPLERLEVVNASLASGKAHFRSLSTSSGFAWSLANMSPIYYNRFFGPRRVGRRRRFTTVVSNVNAPRNQLYLNGAALIGMHPVGLVTKGLDLNIALTNTARSVDFGLLTTLPSAARFVDHYERALQELER